MELDSQTTNSYIDDMIAVLQDGKELIHRHDAKEAVEKLQDLKNKDFIITTEQVEKYLKDIREELATKQVLIRCVASLESVLKQDSEQRKADYDSSKADLQKKLLKVYRDYLLHMPAMPCHPDHECSFEDVYVKPRMTLETKDKERKDIETEVKKLSDIFFEDDNLVKSIYIIGEAGSGKSSFCKSLISCWCKAHSDTQNLDCQNVDDYTEDLFKVMKKFNFLFFLSLRDFTHKLSINDMLEEENEKHPVLKDLLERESETCLIVLDGLDEWSRQCSPKRARSSNYTVLTTSRQWKIGSVGISDNDKPQIIYLNGFDETSRITMITNILMILRKEYPDNKKAKDKDVLRECAKVLSEKPIRSLTHTAMMLQQLICLWFEDRLYATSRCNLYTNMLDLFFVWYKEKDPQSLEKMLEKSYGLELPEYMNNTDECKSHSYIIRNVSLLAYETLIKNEKGTSLTFDSSMFKKLNISHDIKDCCLKLGILSEEKGQRLSPSRSRKSHISFVHKSVQEYLAAVHIVLNISTEQKASLRTESEDLSDYLSQILYVKTVDELLEQENVLIMLCGLEPILAKSISKFMYKKVAKDERFLKYRTTLFYTYEVHMQLLINNIGKLVIDCTEETKFSYELHQFSFDFGDLDIRLLRRVTENNITFDNVLSLYIDLRMLEKEEYDRILQCMTKCKNLEAIRLVLCFNEDVDQRFCDSIYKIRNASTLKCLSVDYTRDLHNPQPLCITPFCHNMCHLVALELGRLTVTHEDFTLLRTILPCTTNLQHISIRIICKCPQLHDVDISKHKQLQYLGNSIPVVLTNYSCTNLEIVRYFLLDKIYCIKVLDFLNDSKKLKNINIELQLVQSDYSGQRDYHITITSKLTHVISLSQQLRKLTLSWFIFTDNIITCPSEMKSLESIDISDVTMSLTTWQKFVDCVAALLQPVQVKTQRLYITQDGEECNPHIHLNRLFRTGGEEGARAFQYVREHEASFNVSIKDEHSITFSTKK